MLRSRLTRPIVVRTLLLFALFNLSLLLTGCTDTWVSQASSLITVLIPAINSALAILAAFGVGISPTAMSAVQKWATDAQSTLTNVIKPVLDSYNAAAASAKATILTSINAALSTIISGLSTALADVHITNPQSQAQVIAIFGLIQTFLTSLINFIPVVQGTVTDHAEAQARISAVKTPAAFRHEFNTMVEPYGPSYKI